MIKALHINWNRRSITRAVATGFPTHRWVLATVALLHLSCGYRPAVATLPEGARAIVVPTVRNYTAIPDVTVPFTSTLRRCVARGGISVASEKEGAPVLDVTVTMVTQKPGMLQMTGDQLSALDTIESVVAEGQLVDGEGNVLEGPARFEVHARFYSGRNPQMDELAGAHRLDQLLDDLAEQIVAHFFYK